MTDDSSAVSAILLRLRQAAGLSIRELERRSGINRANISRAESGEQAPLPATLIRLAEVLDGDASELLTAAGYTATEAATLPSFRPYLRAKYSHLPADAQQELASYLERLEAEYGPQAGPEVATAHVSKKPKKTT